MLDEKRGETEWVWECRCNIIDCVLVHRGKEYFGYNTKIFLFHICKLHYFMLRSLKDPEKLISTF